MVAAKLGAGEAKLVADGVGQVSCGSDINAAVAAVDVQRDQPFDRARGLRMSGRHARTAEQIARGRHGDA